MSRNVFDNNDPYQEHVELSKLSDGPYIVLPPLAEGFKYRIVEISDGSFGVIVKNTGPERDDHGFH